MKGPTFKHKELLLRIRNSHFAYFIHEETEAHCLPDTN